MKSEKDIKIFVTYKDKHKIIETDIIKPIQTGRAIADEAFEGMIGDDTGENISAEILTMQNFPHNIGLGKIMTKLGIRIISVLCTIEDISFLMNSINPKWMIKNPNLATLPMSSKV